MAVAVAVAIVATAHIQYQTDTKTSLCHSLHFDRTILLSEDTTAFHFVFFLWTTIFFL